MCAGGEKWWRFHAFGRERREARPIRTVGAAASLEPGRVSKVRTVYSIDQRATREEEKYIGQISFAIALYTTTMIKACNATY